MQNMFILTDLTQNLRYLVKTNLLNRSNAASWCQHQQHYIFPLTSRYNFVYLSTCCRTLPHLANMFSYAFKCLEVLLYHVLWLFFM